MIMICTKTISLNTSFQAAKLRKIYLKIYSCNTILTKFIGCWNYFKKKEHKKCPPGYEGHKRMRNNYSFLLNQSLSGGSNLVLSLSQLSLQFGNSRSVEYIQRSKC